MSPIAAQRPTVLDRDRALSDQGRSLNVCWGEAFTNNIVIGI